MGVCMSFSDPARYDRFMGRWSRCLAPQFIRFAGVGDGQRVLDVGCGTGSLSRALLAVGKEVRVDGVDPVEAFVEYARQAVGDDRRAAFRASPAETLPFDDGTFDAALALLVLQELADPVQAVREISRVTREGGRIAACQWDFVDGMPMFSLFWRAAETVAPADVVQRRVNTPAPSVTSLGDLAELWRRADLTDVTTSILEIPMRFCSFEDYWQPFSGEATPTTAFAEAINRKTDGKLERTLRDLITNDVEQDGSFVLRAQAWAVVGRSRHESANIA